MVLNKKSLIILFAIFLVCVLTGIHFIKPGNTINAPKY